jgi:hypothetical protein
MDIQYACVASAQIGYEDEYTFFLPWEQEIFLQNGAFTTVVNSFPTESLDYVTFPHPDLEIYLPAGLSCSQSFTYSMQNGNNIPS